MRSVFNQVLVELARRDPRIYMVLADIGYGEIEPFQEAFPERFINCGVAEQNMAGVACGVALEGNIVVTYSIANFPTLRCLEQIRNDSCYHNANVKIVIIGGGLAYGPLGVSHQATEDIAIMRALPNMVVVCPCDFAEAEAATRAMIAHPGPVFYRCGYKKEPPVHCGPIHFQFGKAIEVRDGRDLSFIFTGTIGSQVVPAADILEKDGVRCRILSMHTVKPIDRQAILVGGRRNRRHRRGRGAPAQRRPGRRRGRGARRRLRGAEEVPAHRLARRLCVEDRHPRMAAGSVWPVDAEDRRSRTGNAERQKGVTLRVASDQTPSP